MFAEEFHLSENPPLSEKIVVLAFNQINDPNISGPDRNEYDCCRRRAGGQIQETVAQLFDFSRTEIVKDEPDFVIDFMSGNLPIQPANLLKLSTVLGEKSPAGELADKALEILIPSSQQRKDFFYAINQITVRASEVQTRLAKLCVEKPKLNASEHIAQTKIDYKYGLGELGRNLKLAHQIITEAREAWEVSPEVSYPASTDEAVAAFAGNVRIDLESTIRRGIAEQMQKAISKLQGKGDFIFDEGTQIAVTNAFVALLTVPLVPPVRLDRNPKQVLATNSIAPLIGSANNYNIAEAVLARELLNSIFDEQDGKRILRLIKRRFQLQLRVGSDGVDYRQNNKDLVLNARKLTERVSIHYGKQLVESAVNLLEQSGGVLNHSHIGIYAWAYALAGSRKDFPENYNGNGRMAGYYITNYEDSALRNHPLLRYVYSILAAPSSEALITQIATPEQLKVLSKYDNSFGHLFAEPDGSKFDYAGNPLTKEAGLIEQLLELRSRHSLAIFYDDIDALIANVSSGSLTWSKIQAQFTSITTQIDEII